VLRILHVSDLHFGVHSLADQVQSIQKMIERGDFDVVAVSGDLTQRARASEFRDARRFLEHAEQYSRTIVVPGNHDVAWWRAPAHLGLKRWIFSKWRKHLGREIEPVLEVPGAVFIGVNTAHGITLRTQTKRLRDLSVIGDLYPAQHERVCRVSEGCKPGDRRVVVMHHNPVAGELSKRFGFRKTLAPAVLRDLAAAGIDLVLCGHDHQEAVHFVEHAARGIIVATAGTISNRSRGQRPTSINVINMDQERIIVRVLLWEETAGSYQPGLERTF
jgi:3',5'-cyclic AMP phosphodiesterase CpdA